MTVMLGEALRLGRAWASRGDFQQAADVVCAALPLDEPLPRGECLVEVLDFLVGLDPRVGDGPSEVVIGRLASMACRPPWAPIERMSELPRILRLVELASIASTLPEPMLDLVLRLTLSGDRDTASSTLKELNNETPGLSASARASIESTELLARDFGIRRPKFWSAVPSGEKVLIAFIFGLPIFFIFFLLWVLSR